MFLSLHFSLLIVSNQNKKQFPHDFFEIKVREIKSGEAVDRKNLPNIFSNRSNNSTSDNSTGEVKEESLKNPKDVISGNRALKKPLFRRSKLKIKS